MNKLNLKVGDKCAVKILSGSNEARRFKIKGRSLENLDEWCFEGEVTKVGRKYITVRWGRYSEEQFSIEDDYRNKYNAGGADYQLFESKEAVIEGYKADKLYWEIKLCFDRYTNDKYSLEQLEAVKQILSEE